MELNSQQSNRGILKANAGRRKFTLTRYQPAPELANVIEHYWFVQWDLRDLPAYRQVILSYPNVNIAFEQEHHGRFAGVYGVPNAPYERLLQDQGFTLGVKFRVGGFHPYWKQDVSLLTGQVIGLEQVFGEEATYVIGQIFAQEDSERMAKAAEAFLHKRMPAPDDQVEFVQLIVQFIVDNRAITHVEDVADAFGMSVRTLQRLFSRYVGVSPKWVIQRYRLQDAAELIEQGCIPDWAALSHDLGYYDQAHFIKDFKALIGKSPEEYRKGL